MKILSFADLCIDQFFQLYASIQTIINVKWSAIQILSEGLSYLWQGGVLKCVYSLLITKLAVVLWSLKAQANLRIKNHLCERSPFRQGPQAYFNGHHSPALLIKDHRPFIWKGHRSCEPLYNHSLGNNYDKHMKCTKRWISAMDLINKTKVLGLMEHRQIKSYNYLGSLLTIMLLQLMSSAAPTPAASSPFFLLGWLTLLILHQFANWEQNIYTFESF